MFYNTRITTHIEVDWSPSHRKYVISAKDDHNLPTMPQEFASTIEEVHKVKERMWKQIFEGGYIDGVVTNR